MVDLISDIDSKLTEISKNWRLLTSLKPSNLGDEKNKFVMGDIKNPQFEYSPLDIDFDSLGLDLDSIEIPDNSPIGLILEGRRKQLSLELRLLQSRGGPFNDLFDINQELHGVIPDGLEKQARQLLMEYGNRKDGGGWDDLEFDSNYLKSSLEDCLKENEIEDWEVVFDDRALVVVDSKGKKIKIPRDRMFSSNEVEKLKLHEIGVHVFRAKNGESQTYSIFEHGFPNYTPTEEGLAMFVQERHGLMPPSSYVKIATNALTTSMAFAGHSFRDVFDTLMDLDLQIAREDSNYVWNRTLRAFRGGLFTKDFAYLNGMNQVRTYFESGEDMSKLFVGKIGLEHLGIVSQMKGVQSPRYIPKFN